MAPKGPKQNFGCQPQTLKREEGEGGGGTPPFSCGRRPFQRTAAPPGLALRRRGCPPPPPAVARVASVRPNAPPLTACAAPSPSGTQLVRHDPEAAAQNGRGAEQEPQQRPAEDVLHGGGGGDRGLEDQTAKGPGGVPAHERGRAVSVGPGKGLSIAQEGEAGAGLCLVIRGGKGFNWPSRDLG